jgi:hypothetical protein
MTDQIETQTIYNKSRSAYGVSKGRLEPGSSMELPIDEAQRLIKMYPNMVIDPSTMGGASNELINENKTLKQQILDLQSNIELLKNENYGLNINITQLKNEISTMTELLDTFTHPDKKIGDQNEQEKE